MNIKSLILGSAAALVAGGAAQAADLPVAEPVDYVKVCDAYGAGYFFIPGTDTCLKISGKVEFGIQNGFVDYRGVQRNTVDEVSYYTETTIAFDAKEETEFGTLAAHIEYDDNVGAGATSGANAAFDKAYLQLGGLYAGLTDSIVDFNAGLYYDDFGIGHGDLQTIGYVASLGNGVSATIALEEYNGTGIAGLAGMTAPSLAARLAVKQGWGSANVAGAVYQSRYWNGAFSADVGYIIGGEASFNLMEGLTFGIAGGYEDGYTNDGLGNTWSKWAVNGGFEYAFADNLVFGVDAGYVDFDEAAYKTWGTSAQITYTPVANLEIGARVGYEKTDFDAAAATDWDDVAGKLYLKRSF
ncbi:Porin subfamily protein [Cohaesibacter marisflavi]|uniref:Porin n=1 Tax=Cohaesibacter marisflavi TaxID=655353 RepID=A0A1I5EGF5_9HYPH|nr:porin [Cohaesibacter marisflavi]SFO10547.1 Porin subfamily protein [Cohaesibacter marisflavi]